MNSTLVGELAGLATSFCFTFGSVFFTLAGKHIGPIVLNRTRLVFALLLLGLAHWVVFGLPFPQQAGAQQWFWLGLSGIVGLALGDIFLFSGYAKIGPRLTMLMMSLSPLLSTILAWIFFKQNLSFGQAAGIGITILGVAWVILDKHTSAGASPEPHLASGLLAGIGAAVCQSVGLILARQGLGGDYPALSGNFIRMFCAALVFWSFTLLQGQAGVTVRALRENPLSVGFAFAGAFAGPFLGVSLSLLAIQKADVGVASTLMALPPVLLLPLGYFIFKERFGWQAVVGTLVAIAGTAMLFLV